MAMLQAADAEQKHTRVKQMIAAGVAGALLIGTMGTFAFFTGTDSVSNKYSISDGLQDKITLTETNWDTTDDDGNGIPDAAEKVVPTQTLAKNPVVNNESDVSAYLMAQVKVPTASVKVVQEDGSVEATASSHELWTYTVNSGWTETGTAFVKDGYTVHTYLYNPAVAAGASSAAVFDDITLINLAEGQGLTADQVDVIGFGIQEEGFDNAAAAWDAYVKQNPAEVITNA